MGLKSFYLYVIPFFAEEGRPETGTRNVSRGTPQGALIPMVPTT
jgi:hypothetical protein